MQKTNTHTDTVIPKDADHHLQRRTLAIHNYCHRTITLLEDNNNKKKGTNVIKQIAINNYQPKIVDNTMNIMTSR